MYFPVWKLGLFQKIQKRPKTPVQHIQRAFFICMARRGSRGFNLPYCKVATWTRVSLEQKETIETINFSCQGVSSMQVHFRPRH